MKRFIPFILIFIGTACLADSGAYRIEVIVFQNIDVMAAPDTTENLRSFSHFPSLFPDRTTSAETQDLSEALPGDPAAELPDGPDSVLPDDLVIIGERSEYMNDVWRRLRTSKWYRPLIWSSWQQNRVDYYPPMRLHDETLIDTQLNPPTNMMVADLTAPDPLAEYRSEFYLLDGSVQLRRSRFLHIFLDLEIRENSENSESIQPGTVTGSVINATTGLIDGLGGLPDNNPGYEIHSLKQSRQIQTGKLQYFDTPHFGALVFVTAISN